MNAKEPAASPAKDTVYIDAEDEITAIIDKVEATKSKVVALMLPKRATTLQSVVNMRLLKRAADNAKKNIVLVTTETALMPLAGAVGIHVAKSLQSKPEIPASPIAEAEEIEPPLPADAEEDDVDERAAKLDYHRSIGELAAAHEDEEPEVIALDDQAELPQPKTPKAVKPAKGQKLKVPNFERFRLLMFGGIAALIALIIFIFLAIFVLPKATIAIQTSSSPISANLNLSASDKFTALDEAKNQIPASLKASVQASQQQVNATGQQNQGNKASGTIKISAGACSGDVPNDISAGTGTTSGGLTFITQKKASFSPSVSGGKCTFQSNSVDILAQSGGAKYNGMTSFTISGYSATATSATAGGTDSIVTVVSQQDVDNAKSKISAQNTDDYTQKFIKQLEDGGFYVLKSTLKVGDPSVVATPGVGQPATSVNVAIQVNHSVLVVPKADLSKAINDTLNDQIDKTKQKISSNDVLKDASVTVVNQTGPAAASLSVSETTTAVPIINVASVKQQAAGKKSGDIKTNLSNLPGVKTVDVQLKPFWVSKAPKKTSKITVKLQQVKD